MATKRATIYNTSDSSNPNFSSKVVFVQGKRYEIKNETEVQVPEIVKEIMEDSSKNYRRFARSNTKITPESTVLEDNIRIF